MPSIRSGGVFTIPGNLFQLLTDVWQELSVCIPENTALGTSAMVPLGALGGGDFFQGSWLPAC